MPWHDGPSGRIYWRQLGDGAPLLMVHGLGSSGADWAFQVPPLLADFRLLLPDLPGSGRSEVPTGRIGIPYAAEALWHLLDAQAGGRTAIVGFSLGGAVALEMALQRPQDVERLVLINSLPSYRVDHWRKWLELYLQIGIVRMLGLPRAARMVAARLFPLPHQAPMRERVTAVVGANPVGPYLQTARGLAAWCAADRLDRLRAPTLMIAGEHDYTPLDEKRVWATRLRAELVCIRASRHGTPFDAVAATNACIEAFLRGQPLPAEALRVADSPEAAPRQAPVSLDEEIA